VRKGEHGTKVYFVKQLAIKKDHGEESDTRLIVPWANFFRVLTRCLPRQGRIFAEALSV
jgi:hypothetical protein